MHWDASAKARKKAKGPTTGVLIRSGEHLRASWGSSQNTDELHRNRGLRNDTNRERRFWGNLQGPREKGKVMREIEFQAVPEYMKFLTKTLT